MLYLTLSFTKLSIKDWQHNQSVQRTGVNQFVRVEYKLKTKLIYEFKSVLSIVRKLLGIHFSSVLGCPKM